MAKGLTECSEQFYKPATLGRTLSGSLVPIGDPPASRAVPWVASTRIPDCVAPIVVSVREGQTLFLPAGWWHRVEQEEGAGGLAVAIN